MDKERYMAAFHEVLCDYCSDPDNSKLFNVLSALFEGIEKNYALPCPARMNFDTLEAEPMFIGRTNGDRVLVVLTSTDGIQYPELVTVKLRALVDLMIDTDDCEGLLFNPLEKSEFFVPKSFLAYAICMGYNMAVNDMEADRAAQESAGSVQ